jgi:transposase
MGFVSASTILAEIGDFRDFSSPDKLAAYCGLVPSVYQSAGKLINGHITKHGSPHIRSMIIDVAHAIIRTKRDSKLKKFFLRVNARRLRMALIASYGTVIASDFMLEGMITSRIDHVVIANSKAVEMGIFILPKLSTFRS